MRVSLKWTTRPTLPFTCHHSKCFWKLATCPRWSTCLSLNRTGLEPVSSDWLLSLATLNRKRGVIFLPGAKAEWVASDSNSDRNLSFAASTNASTVGVNACWIVNDIFFFQPKFTFSLFSNRIKNRDWPSWLERKVGRNEKKVLLKWNPKLRRSFQRARVVTLRLRAQHFLAAFWVALALQSLRSKWLPTISPRSQRYFIVSQTLANGAPLACTCTRYSLLHFVSQGTKFKLAKMT